jgi:hypothetical protein
VKFLPSLILDLIALSGLGVFLLGVDMIYRPAALVIGGLVVFAGAAGMSRAFGPERMRR